MFIIYLVVLLRVRPGVWSQALFAVMVLVVVAWSAFWNDFLPGPILDGLLLIKRERDGTPNGRGDFFDRC